MSKRLPVTQPDHGRFVDGILDSKGTSAMGCNQAPGSLGGVAYDAAPTPWICDQLQWVTENSPYILQGTVLVRGEGWFVGWDLYWQDSGDPVLDRNGDPIRLEPEIADGSIEDITNIQKIVYKMSARLADNTIRWMIEEGLTNGSA